MLPIATSLGMSISGLIGGSVVTEQIFNWNGVGTLFLEANNTNDYPLMMGIVKQTLNLHGHIHHNSVNIAENINVGVDAPERDLLVPHLPFGTPLTAAEIHEIYRLKVAVLSKER